MTVTDKLSSKEFEDIIARERAENGGVGDSSFAQFLFFFSISSLVTGAVVYLFTSPVYAISLDENLPLLAGVGLIASILLSLAYSSSAALYKESFHASREVDLSGVKTKDDKAYAAVSLDSSNTSEAVALSLFVNNICFVGLFLALALYVMPQIPESLEVLPIHNFVTSTSIPALVVFLRAKQLF